MRHTPFIHNTIHTPIRIMAHHTTVDAIAEALLANKLDKSERHTLLGRIAELVHNRLDCATAVACSKPLTAYLRTALHTQCSSAAVVVRSMTTHMHNHDFASTTYAGLLLEFATIVVHDAVMTQEAIDALTGILDDAQQGPSLAWSLRALLGARAQLPQASSATQCIQGAICSWVTDKGCPAASYLVDIMFEMMERHGEQAVDVAMLSQLMQSNVTIRHDIATADKILPTLTKTLVSQRCHNTEC
jgi:hypothetical protein